MNQDNEYATFDARSHPCTEVETKHDINEVMKEAICSNFNASMVESVRGR